MSYNRKKERDNAQLAKRKRVNRFKTIIVAGVVILIGTSVILNIILVFKVLHLESQINKLYSQNSVVITQDDLELI